MRDSYAINGHKLTGGACTADNIIGTLISSFNAAQLSPPSLIANASEHQCGPDEISMGQQKLNLLKNLLAAACRTEVGGATIESIHAIFSPRTFNVCPSCELARPIEINVSHSSSHCITVDIESTIEFWVRRLDRNSFFGSPSTKMSLAEDNIHVNEETPLLTARFKNRFVVDAETFHVKYTQVSVRMNLESPEFSFIAKKAAEKMRKATITQQEYWEVVDKHKSLEVRKKMSL